MSAKKIIEGLRDALAGRVTRISVVRTTTERRIMTTEEEAAMDKVFDQMDKTFDAMDDFFKTLKP